MKKAFITGITGQDGSYLAELLLDKGYEVHGLVRRQSTIATERIDHLYVDPHTKGCRLFLHFGDLSDGTGLARLLTEIQPDEIYNLGAQSHVRVSFDTPEYTVDVDATGTIRLLEAIRLAGLTDTVRFYQASSSEMFGGGLGLPMTADGYDEDSLFDPRSPYACAKVFSYYAVRNYRSAYRLHASNGILFNHSSPRRGPTFVSRKITRGIAAIITGKQKKLFLGDLRPTRDWGFAGDYVRAMWLMLQQDQPDDYVVATGESHSVREFCCTAFEMVGLDFHDYVEYDARYARPSEVWELLGNAHKIRTITGWAPEMTFEKLIETMLVSDLRAAGVADPESLIAANA